jgi:hypothetical protein
MGGHVDGDVLHRRLVPEPLGEDRAVAEVPADLAAAAVLPEAVLPGGGVGLGVTGNQV